MKLSTSVLLSLLGSSTMVNAMLPIHIKNYRFIKPSSPDNDSEENDVFFIKGVDYQPGGSSGYDADSNSDVLSDAEACARDAFVFQQLGINTVRIYSLNPDVNHDKCMTILNDAGIYVMLDVNSGNYGENLNRADPSGSYNSQYLTRVFKFIDAFKNYPNVLGFFSGNEVINDEKDYADIDPQYVRAVQRDMKQYIAKHSNRTIPVGYSAADNSDLRLATFKYLQCNSMDGKKVSKELDESKADFFGLNTYGWCSGSSDWTTSGYDILNSTFSDAVIPLMFSEYGCNKNIPRTFDEVTDGLYPSNGLGNLFSGGLVYEFAEEANNYGLVKLDDSDGSMSYKDDFDNLKFRYDKLELPTTKESDISNSTIYKCDASRIQSSYSDFGVKNFTLPKQPDTIANLIKYGVNGTNVGKLLDDYDVPTTFNYTIKDSNGDEVSATLSYASSNLINNLKGVSTANIASSSSSSTSQSRISSSVSTSSSSFSSSSSSSSSTSSASRSSGAADFLSIPIYQSSFMTLFTGLISALL
ncbi:putative 1,3-beta-glucanosyltransferase NDAI_0K01040 [Naumovozyma dairenensis CBS 421]|uniref:1,3-beta-glucanosyltransferase n=1 Tax=Naumovozyma dairenensis (strain ATCC 10597 / BCRC 20456 / CBS 421 / NBRC 0211 / NRRL Y-12639) TaxID=1071378 RepID=G0WHN4_NAUDC|nr:hypothetical protein NDAI_0K01040 [Naumovozyma dairenensis CBS 421]CCD27295.1 hypothetical protein NDAI_0K01040 [Naumovozyma dairenensis CBS 421]